MWTRSKKDLQLGMELDNWCWIADIFKSPEGYCDCWEPNVEES